MIRKPDSTRFDLEEVATILARTPVVLRAWLPGLPQTALIGRDGPDTWNALEVVAHLIHGERTDWISRARIILAQGPSIRFVPFDRTAHLQQRDERSIDQLVDEFTGLRDASLEVLHGWSLGPEQLALPGEHPELGPVTLRELLATWAAHDLSHLTQIARTMARQYRQQVGPWLAYLNTLK